MCIIRLTTFQAVYIRGLGDTGSNRIDESHNGVLQNHIPFFLKTLLDWDSFQN